MVFSHLVALPVSEPVVPESGTTSCMKQADEQPMTEMGFWMRRHVVVCGLHIAVSGGS